MMLTWIDWWLSSVGTDCPRGRDGGGGTCAILTSFHYTPPFGFQFFYSFKEGIASAPKPILQMMMSD